MSAPDDGAPPVPGIRILEVKASRCPQLTAHDDLFGRRGILVISARARTIFKDILEENLAASVPRGIHQE